MVSRSSSHAARPHEALPARIPGYRLNYRLGRGGMGTVFHATQESLDRPVAIKILSGPFSQSKEMVSRFEREAGALGRLNHPNIVSVIERGKVDALYYYVMEFVEGRSLNDVLREKLILGRDEFVRMIHQVASALDYIHQHGIIHRDIKPGNILRDQAGDFRLSDFGLIHISRPSSSGSASGGSSVVGTPMYLAPEQLHASEEITPATDIYSFGVICYEQLTGMLPLGRFKMPSELNPTLVPAIDEPIRTALSRDAADRYQSVRDFEAAMVAAIEQAPNLRLRPCKRTIEAEPSDLASSMVPGGSSISVVRAGTRRQLAARRTPVYVGILFVLLVALIGAVLFWPRDVAEDAAVPQEVARPEQIAWIAEYEAAVDAARRTDRVVFLVVLARGVTAESIELGPATRDAIAEWAVAAAVDRTRATSLVARLQPPSGTYVYILSSDGERVLRESSWPVIGMNVADFVRLGHESAAAYARWFTDFDAAMEKARAEGRRLFILAGCGEPRERIETLKLDIGIDPIVAPLMREYVLLSAETKESCDRVAEEGFISFPIIAVYDPERDEYINEDRLTPTLLYELPAFLRRN